MLSTLTPLIFFYGDNETDRSKVEEMKIVSKQNPKYNYGFISTAVGEGMIKGFGVDEKQTHIMMLAPGEKTWNRYLYIGN